MSDKLSSKFSYVDEASNKIEPHKDVFRFHFIEWMAAHLADCSKVFKGDLIEMLVLTIVGQAFVRVNANLAARKYSLDGDDKSVSISYIAEASGIPRETVRRKLASLKKRGWVEQVEGGEWKLRRNNESSVAGIELKDLQDRGVARMVYMIEMLGPYLQKD